MAKKKTSAIIAQPGTPADGYTLDVKYDPDNEAFEAKAIFNDGNVETIGENADEIVSAILDGTATKVVTSATKIRQYAFYNVASITEYILNEVTNIELYGISFSNAKIFMPKIENLGNNSIRNYGRSKFYLPSTLTSIADGAFNGSTALTDIYCDFSQGSVNGAPPWGATNATVHYNVPYPASVDEME